MTAFRAPMAFGIGSDVWPGVSKLNEEAGEVVCVIGKMMQTGGDSDHWSGDLKQMLIEEMGDVLAAVRFVSEHNDLVDVVEARAAYKKALFEKWHLEQRQLKTGTEPEE